MLPPNQKAVQLIMAMATYQVWGVNDTSVSGQIERAKKQALYNVCDRLSYMKKETIFGVRDEWIYWNSVRDEILNYNLN